MVRAVCEEEEAEDAGIDEEAEAEAQESTRRRRRSDRATQVAMEPAAPPNTPRSCPAARRADVGSRSGAARRPAACRGMPRHPCHARPRACTPGGPRRTSLMSLASDPHDAPRNGHPADAGVATLSVSMAWARASSEPAPWRHNLGALRDMSSWRRRGSFERRCLLITDAADLVEISSVFNHFP